MPMMTQTALSDCSYPESTVYNIRDEINATITRLKTVIDEEASLRKALRTLFVKRKEEAIKQVRLVNLHLDLVNEEEAAFCDDLKHAEAAANEGLDGAGSLAKVELVPPPFIPTPTDPAKVYSTTPNLNPVEREPVSLPKMATQHDVCDNTAPPQSLARATRSLDATVPSRSLEESPVGLSNEPPRSPARSKCGLPDEPTRSPAGSFHCNDPLRSPARSTRVLDYDPMPNSPARSNRGLPHDAPSRSPARSTRGSAPSVRGFNNGPIPISPARSNRGLPSDAPPCSPAKSTGGLDDAYLSPGDTSHPQRTPGTVQTSLPGFSFGDNHGAGTEEPEESPAATFSVAGGGLGTSPMANTGFGFGAIPATNTCFGFGASTAKSTGFGFGVIPTTNAGFAFGAPSQSQSASIGFGTATLPTTGFGFVGAFQPSLAVDFGSNGPSFGAPTYPMQTPAAAEDELCDLTKNIGPASGSEIAEELPPSSSCEPPQQLYPRAGSSGIHQKRKAPAVGRTRAQAAVSIAQAQLDAWETRRSQLSKRLEDAKLKVSLLDSDQN